MRVNEAIDIAPLLLLAHKIAGLMQAEGAAIELIAGDKLDRGVVVIQLLVLDGGHFSYPQQAAQEQGLLHEINRFFAT